MSWFVKLYHIPNVLLKKITHSILNQDHLMHLETSKLVYTQEVE